MHMHTHVHACVQLGEFRHSKGEFTLRGLHGRADSSGGQNKLDVKQLLLVASVNAAGRVDAGEKGLVALDDSLSEAMARKLAEEHEAKAARAAAKAAKAAAKCGGLREEELQFVVCLLGEHLAEEQARHPPPPPTHLAEEQARPSSCVARLASTLPPPPLTHTPTHHTPTHHRTPLG